MIKQICCLVLLGTVFYQSYGDPQKGPLNFEIINEMDNKIIKDCRVSPNGLYAESPSHHLRRTDYLSEALSGQDILRSIQKDFLGVIGNDFTSCGTGHDEYCDGYSLGGSVGGSVLHNWMIYDRSDLDSNVYVKNELLSRIAAANYTGLTLNSEHKSVNYKGWRFYNVKLAKGGGIVIGIEAVPTRLNIECDLYDADNHDLSTFGYVFEYGKAVQFYNGGDSRIISTKDTGSTDIEIYKITYKDE